MVILDNVSFIFDVIILMSLWLLEFHFDKFRYIPLFSSSVRAPLNINISGATVEQEHPEHHNNSHLHCQVSSIIVKYGLFDER